MIDVDHSLCSMTLDGALRGLLLLYEYQCCTFIRSKAMGLCTLT